MIRQAKPLDKDKVCDLILSASSCLFEDVLKTEDLEKQKQLLTTYYDMKNTKFSYQNIIVFEQDNLVVACLVYYDTDLEQTFNKNMETILNNGYHFTQEGEPGTVYLDSIAVDNNYQNLGISRKLFEYTIDHSSKNLSLLVETYKENVEAYYKRLGFKVIKHLNAFNCDLNLMLYEL